MAWHGLTMKPGRPPGCFHGSPQGASAQDLSLTRPGLSCDFLVESTCAIRQHEAFLQFDMKQFLKRFEGIWRDLKSQEGHSHESFKEGGCIGMVVAKCLKKQEEMGHMEKACCGDVLGSGRWGPSPHLGNGHPAGTLQAPMLSTSGFQWLDVVGGFSNLMIIALDGGGCTPFLDHESWASFPVDDTQAQLVDSMWLGQVVLWRQTNIYHS